MTESDPRHYLTPLIPEFLWQDHLRETQNLGRVHGAEVRHVGRRQLLSRGPTQHLLVDAREQALKADPVLDHSHVMRVLERLPVLTRLWVLQTLKCRSQLTRTSLNVGTLPVVRIQKHQTPAHPANQNRTFQENVQIYLPHALISYIGLTVKR